jgi:hypothetical protein
LRRSAGKESVVAGADCGPKGGCIRNVEIESVSKRRDEFIRGIQQLLIGARRMDRLQDSAAQGDQRVGCATFDKKFLDEWGNRIRL